MKTVVKLFAVAKQLAGRDEVEIELPDQATVADVRQQLGNTIPDLADMLPSYVFAVDKQYAHDATCIAPGAEIAAIPPVSGG